MDSSNAYNLCAVFVVEVFEIGKMLEVLKGLGLPLHNANESWWSGLGLSDFDVERVVTRLEAAVVIDAAFDPFGMFGVDYDGNFTR